MANKDIDKIVKLVENEIRELKDIVEIIKHKVDTSQIFLMSTTENIKLMKEQQSIINEKLDNLTKETKELREDVDAARGDIELMHMDVKGIKEKESLFHSRNKREVDEIKTHLGMPLIPDVPAV